MKRQFSLYGIRKRKVCLKEEKHKKEKLLNAVLRCEHKKGKADSQSAIFRYKWNLKRSTESLTVVMTLGRQTPVFVLSLTQPTYTHHMKLRCRCPCSRIITRRRRSKDLDTSARERLLLSEFILSARVTRGRKEGDKLGSC
ncbi:hypothetical protein J6590_089679 [Homalodisca vitripennis]|nr:hypothetical protein J6590_060487 [Homalodisca vitripennis]KAG8309294.1 hypothetical protein J6590_089679 [Homalodisca vitripennis]